MLTTGDALADFSVHGVKPRIGSVNLGACFTKLVGRPDATRGQAVFSWTENRTFTAKLHAAVRLVSAAGLSVQRDPRDVRRTSEALQGGALCPGNRPRATNT